MDTVAVDLARKAMEVIEEYYKKQQTLKFTTFCAMVVQLPNRNNARAVVVASAGKTASGITGKLVDELDAALCAGGGVAIIPCAAPTAGQSNDAEQQALRTVENPGDATFADAAIKAVAANRDICGECGFTLRQRGLTVTGHEAIAP